MTIGRIDALTIYICVYACVHVIICVYVCTIARAACTIVGTVTLDTLIPLAIRTCKDMDSSGGNRIAVKSSLPLISKLVGWRSPFSVYASTAIAVGAWCDWSMAAALKPNITGACGSDQCKDEMIVSGFVWWWCSGGVVK